MPRRMASDLSIEVLTWAMRNSKARLGDRLVLLVLADHAKHDGTCAWPSVQTIALRALLSERQVKRCLANLKELGEIAETGKSKAGTVIYEIPPYRTWDVRVTALESQESGGDILSNGSDIHASEVGQDVTRSVQEQPSGTTPPTPPLGEDVLRVYEHWRGARRKTRSNYVVMSPARQRKIRTRLREFTADDLCRAIDNVANDPWPERPRHDDITILFRSRETVDRFLEMGAGGKRQIPPLERAQSFIRNVGHEYPMHDLLDELGKFDLSPSDKRSAIALAESILADEAA